MQTQLYVSSDSIEHVNEVLQQELKLVSEWITENKLKLNVLKTKCMALGSKYALRIDQKLSLSLKGATVEQVKEVKLLGVTIDESLSWSTQIKKTVVRMIYGIYAIRRSAHLLTNTSIRLVIQSLVLSNLDYCPVIWSSASKQEINKLQLAQNRAARLALRCSCCVLHNIAMNHGCV